MKHYIGIAIVLLGGVSIAHAFVSSSSNYRLEADSINTAGSLSSSTNYGLEDTVGEIGSGVGSSTNYQLKAGYQQMLESSLSLSSPSSVNLLPAIPQNGGGVATGSAQWTVITDNVAGYSFSIRASGSPALTSGINSFANYTPGGIPDFAFSVGAATSEFGFSPEGSDIVGRYRDDGVSCNTGVADAINSCWDALTTSNQLIASRNSQNGPSGTQTTIKFRAESGASNSQPSGFYSATTTVVVLAR